MSDDLTKQIWEEGGRPRTYSPEAAAHFLNQDGNSDIVVFIRRGETRQNVIDVFSSYGLRVEVSEPWSTLAEKSGTKGLSVKKVEN